MVLFYKFKSPAIGGPEVVVEIWPRFFAGFLDAMQHATAFVRHRTLSSFSAPEPMSGTTMPGGPRCH